MIMVGLRGTSSGDAKSFFDSLDGLTVGGIILYDQNVTTTPPSPHNIQSPEQVKKFSILPRDLAIDDGELTPTLKIRRKQIRENWSAEIEAMYAE